MKQHLRWGGGAGRKGDEPASDTLSNGKHQPKRRARERREMIAGEYDNNNPNRKKWKSDLCIRCEMEKRKIIRRYLRGTF